MSQFGNGWGNGPPGWDAPPPGNGPPQQGYGPPPQQGYGPPPQQGYGPPPQQGYGPPQQQGYGPPGAYQQPYGASPMVPFGGMAGVWVCRWCGYQGFPMQRQKISTGGIVVAIVLFFIFLPLFWIGLLMKETITQCPQCRRQ